MLELLKAKNKYCTGCGACYNICPKDAIHMEPNPQGFLYPMIDEEICIHCKNANRYAQNLEQTYKTLRNRIVMRLVQKMMCGQLVPLAECSRFWRGGF